MTKQDSWLGSLPDDYETRIDPDAAKAFALATNDPNPVYLEGRAVPPILSAALIRTAAVVPAGRSAAAGLIRGGSSAVHGEHEVNFFKPIEPGQIVRWSADSHSLRQTSAGAVLTRRIVVTDTAGVALAEHLWTNVHIGATIESELGPDPVGHAFPPEARNHSLGQHTFSLSFDQAYRYAGVSGDHVAHAVDGAAAREEGFPGRILQGLCTMAMCSGAVIKLAADGDPTGLRRLAVRMAAPVLASQDLTVEVYDAGIAADGTKVIAFEARTGDATVIKHGRAEFAG